MRIRQMGPRKADDGNWLPHSLLGDIEDYEEMERELQGSSIQRPETYADAETTAVRFFDHQVPAITYL